MKKNNIERSRRCRIHSFGWLWVVSVCCASIILVPISTGWGMSDTASTILTDMQNEQGPASGVVKSSVQSDLISILPSTGTEVRREWGSVSKAPRETTVESSGPDALMTGGNAGSRKSGISKPRVVEYRVWVTLEDEAQVQMAQGAGLSDLKLGKHVYDVSPAVLLRLRSFGINATVAGGVTEFSVVYDSAEEPTSTTEAADSDFPVDTGTIELYSGTVNMYIEDNTGSGQYYRLRNQVAPAGSEVTLLEYRTRIDDEGDGNFYCRDYEIWLFSGDVEWETCVYDNLGGATDGGYDDDSADDYDIYLNWRTMHYFDGEDPNQWWGIICYDNLSGDDGRMNYIEFKVHWESEEECADLTPYKPSNWDDKIPIGVSQLSWDETHSYSGPYYSNQVLYFNWGSANNGNAGASGYTVHFEVTGTGGGNWNWTNLSTDPGYWTHLTNDQAVGPLSAGSHTFKLWVDYTDAVDECDGGESNNYYERTITVVDSAYCNLEIPLLVHTEDVCYQGGSLGLSADVRNAGSATCSNVEIQYYLSTNNTISTSDCYVGSKWVTLSPGATNVYTLTVDPSTIACLSPGNWYWGVVIPSENEVWGTANLDIIDCGSSEPDIHVEPTSLTFTQELSASTGAGDPGVETRTIPNGLAIRSIFTANQLKFWTKRDCQQVFLKGGVLPEDEPGTLWLPAKYINVLIPAGASVASIETSANEVLVAEGIDVCPVQPPVRLGAPAPAPTDKNAAAYAIETKVPAKLAEVTGHHTMRGFTYVSIRLNPVRYIPARKELYLAKNLNVTLQFEEHRIAVAAPPANNEIFKSMLRSMVVNGDMLDTEDFTPRMLDEIPAETIDYLIITSSALQSTFQTLADHRASHNGFSTRVVTIENIYQNPSYDGDDNQEEIRNCIEDYVNNKSTAYVVLGGDDEVVPDRDCYVRVWTCDQQNCWWETENNMPTDLYYAGLNSSWDEDGDGTYGEADTSSGDEGDLAPDVLVGRIPVQSSSQASDYIDKLIDYENNPPSENFREKFLILGDELWDHYTGSDRPSDSVSDGFSGFMGHSPVSDAEMWLRRLYRDGIQPDWEPSTLAYFFDTLTSWDGSTPGDYLQNSSHVSTRFNEGWYHVFFGTHGSKTTWSLESGSFSDSSASALNGSTTIIYTMACLTGHFDGSSDPCLSEAFLRNDDGGALAYFGCSRFGWGSPDPPPASNTSRGGTSLEYAYEFYDQLLNSGEDILGQVFSQHKANLAGSCGSNGSYRWVQFGMNYQGDPAFSLSGSGLSDSFTIYNDGNYDLEIMSMTKRDGDPWLSWAPTAPLTIAPGGSQVITVSVDWDLANIGTNQERIIIGSNDPDENPYPNAVYITAEKSCSEPPVGDFSGSPRSGCAPLTVNFTDQSTGSPTSWSWSFGDGGTSTQQNPSHTYNEDGIYTVTLTVSNACGSDSETKTGYIVVKVKGKAMPWLLLLLDEEV